MCLLGIMGAPVRGEGIIMSHCTPLIPAELSTILENKGQNRNVTKYGGLE
jgi:hypothetical protein